MFGAFVVKKWHFPTESPEFCRKVAEFRSEFPEFRFLNLNSPSVRKMRFSAEFRLEFRFRWSAGFVKKRKGELWGEEGRGRWQRRYPPRRTAASNDMAVRAVDWIRTSTTCRRASVARAGAGEGSSVFSGRAPVRDWAVAPCTHYLRQCLVFTLKFFSKKINICMKY